MANLNLSLRARIFLSMILLIIITFMLTGAVLIYHFQREEKEYHKERIKRKEYAVRASIDYFLTPYKDGLREKEIPEVFTDKICEIADIHNLDLALYSTTGYLLISSNEAIIDEKILPLRMDQTTLYQVLNQNHRLKFNHQDTLEYMSSYSIIYSNKHRPLAIVNIPYYTEVEGIQQQDLQFMRALAGVYLLLFVGAVVIAYMLSNYISASLRTVGLKLNEIRLNKSNEKLHWRSKDEIGKLVDEFNRMVAELEKSAVLLAKSERESAWKEMARQVAHEIKNPLTPMRLMVQHLDATLPTNEPEELHEHTAAMLVQIDAMSSIAEAFSRFAEMPEYNKEQLNLNQLLANSVQLYPALAIDVEVPETPIFVLADRELLIRVLNNLIKNAQQAIAENQTPKISLGAKQKADVVLIWIKDNGAGIPEAQQAKIFEPSFTTKNTGMGMGLAIVQSIVAGHNGKIWLKSTPGVGTTFYIELPINHTESKS